MFEPRLKVAGAGLDDGAGMEPIRRESGERVLVEIVEQGEAMLAGRAEIDVRTAGVAVLEQWNPGQYRLGGNAIESGEHATLAEDTESLGSLSARPVMAELDNRV